MMLGYADEEVNRFFAKALFAVGEDWNMDALLPIVMEVGEKNLQCMALLDKANTESYGTPAVSYTHLYELDERGQRIADGRGGWKNHREDTTDWNNKEQAEVWRSAWADYTNRALEAAGEPERIEHRSYQRQDVQKIPSVHLGVAAKQMEKRGIVTRKGDLNRQITADNKLLKEIKARICLLYTS